MFTFLSHILAWEVNTAYIMKLVDEERYIVRSKGLIRVVDGSKLTDIANPIIAFEMVKVADDEYALKYCDNFHLSTKTTDPGIEASDYDSWVFMQHGDGFKLKQKNYGQCLTAVEHFDAANKGNYMNRRPCESTLPNVFQLLEIGDMDFQCLIDQPAICSKLGLVK